MQVRALKTFSHKKYGLVRTGMVLTVPTTVYEAWRKLSPPLAVEYVPPQGAAAPGPSENKSIPGAPANKAPKPKAEKEPGKANPPSANATRADSAKAGRKAGGRGKRSSSAPADPASQPRT